MGRGAHIGGRTLLLAAAIPIAAFFVVFGVSLALLSRDTGSTATPRTDSGPARAAGSGRLVTSIEQPEAGFVKRPGSGLALMHRPLRMRDCKT
jgi:hypothetical protein